MARDFNPPGDRSSELAAMVFRLQAERQAASRQVDRLLRDTPRENWLALSDHPHLVTVGGLERLAARVAELIGKDMPSALAIASLAVSVSEGLEPDSYHPVTMAQVRAHALKDLGKVLRELARHQEAIDTFLCAEEALTAHLALHHDLALIRLHLGFTYQEVDRYDEAFALIRESKQVFTAYGDARMLLIAGIAEGALYQRLARHREAREAYLLLLASSKPDFESAAALHKNIGLCCIELGDYAEAEANLRESVRLYTGELGQPIETLKAQTAYGRLLIPTGRVERGIAHLKPIRRAFLGQGMPEEAGICALEIIEGLLTRNKAETAERLARMVIAEFTRAQLNKRAITALGYLTRVIAVREASVPLVQNVRDYILALRTNPEREFPRRVLPTASGPGQGSEQ